MSLGTASEILHASVGHEKPALDSFHGVRVRLAAPAGRFLNTMSSGIMESVAIINNLKSSMYAPPPAVTATSNLAASAPAPS